MELPLEPVPVELDAPLVAGLAVELDVSLLEPVEPLVLPDVEPVPVAPIELVPLLEPGVAELPVVVPPLPLIEPELDGDVEAVEPLDEGELLEPGVVVVDDVVLDSRLVQAPSERAVTARTAAVTWVRVIFIGKLLKSDS